MENGARFNPSREMEDALMYLPRKAVTSFRKGQLIFDEHQPSTGLHLVVQGRVKVTIPIDDGTETQEARQEVEDHRGVHPFGQQARVDDPYRNSGTPARPAAARAA